MIPPNVEVVTAPQHVILAGKASRAVKHQVSDTLQARHPYNAATGFPTQRGRDAGKAFNGMMPAALETLVGNLADTQMPLEQKAVVLQHLIAHSAAAETKVVLLRLDVVPALCNLLKQGVTARIEELCANVLFSLCNVPQGCHCAVIEGGLRALLTIVAKRDGDSRESARRAALQAIGRLAFTWEGRGWILGCNVTPNLELTRHHSVDPAPTPEETESLAQGTLDVLVAVLEHDRNDKEALRFATDSLSLLTMEERGVHLALVAGALRACSRVMEHYAGDPTWLNGPSRDADASVVQSTALAIWHMGMDSVGKTQATELPLVPLCTSVLKDVLALSMELFSLKAQLAGAVCAMVLHPTLKALCLEPLPLKAECPLDQILSLLRQANAVLEALRPAVKANKPSPFTSPTMNETLAVVKNSVQAIRLVAELPRAREYLHRVIGGANDRDLRRQLFASTDFQKEFVTATV